MERAAALVPPSQHVRYGHHLLECEGSLSWLVGGYHWIPIARIVRTCDWTRPFTFPAYFELWHLSSDDFDEQREKNTDACSYRLQTRIPPISSNSYMNTKILEGTKKKRLNGKTWWDALFARKAASIIKVSLMSEVTSNKQPQDSPLPTPKCRTW